MKIKFILILLLFGIFHLQGQGNSDYTITEDCGVTISVDITSANCGQSDGSAIISLGPGIAPIIQNGLAAGTYPISIPYTNECVITGTFTIGQNSDFRVHDVYPSGCAPDATVVVELRGGTQPYSEDSGQAVPVVSSFFRFTGLSSGPHTVSFTDANGCITETTFIVPEELSVRHVRGFGCAPDGGGIVVIEGGTPPYSETSGQGVQSFPSIFFFNGLPAGSHPFYFEDVFGCTVQATIVIEEELYLDEIEIIDATCDFEGNSGWVEFTIGGGVGPYSEIPGDIQPANGHYLFQGLSPGEYEWTVFDRKGCSTIVSATVGFDDEPCCSFDFDPITQAGGPRDENPSDNIYAETITNSSFEPVTVEFCLDAACIPDRLSIRQNGRTVASVIAGSGRCKGISGNVIECVTLCVNPGDIIHFAVEGNVCRDNGCPSVNTAWTLDVNCLGSCGDGGGGDEITFPSRPSTLRQNYVDLEAEQYREQLKLSAQESVMVFPNPVTDLLNITIADHADYNIEYQSLRIIDFTGKVIQSKNISDIDNLQIDASDFPEGIYILELADKNGNKISKRFTKIE